MKELEGMVLGSIVSENQFNKVSFLEAEDFNNYPDKPYRNYFKLVKESGGKPDALVSLIKICKEKGIKFMDDLSYLSAYHNLSRYALFMLETRFKNTLSSLLVDLSLSTNNALESDILNEVNSSIIKEDIFVLGDNILDYLGHQGSDITVSRIKSYLDWRNNRIETTKKIINEFK